MKKNFLIIALIALFVLPIKVAALPAEYSSYETMNLDEALTQEEVEHDLSNYKETSDQVTIYLFRGYGCPHCQEFLEFLNSIIDDYGDKFKLVSFEVWYDENNGNLMNEVATALNTTANGIPFIIIGEKVFPGYAASLNDQIIAQIESEYNKKDRYDIFEEMAKELNKKEASPMAYIILIVSANFIFVTLATCLIINYNKKNHNEILDAIDELEEKLTNNNFNK